MKELVDTMTEKKERLGIIDRFNKAK